MHLWITAEDEKILHEHEANANSYMENGNYLRAYTEWENLRDYVLHMQDSIIKTYTVSGGVVGFLSVGSIMPIFAVPGAWLGGKLMHVIFGNSVRYGLGLPDIVRRAETAMSLCRYIDGGQ